jgi:hypothetical protein
LFSWQQDLILTEGAQILFHSYARIKGEGPAAWKKKYIELDASALREREMFFAKNAQNYLTCMQIPEKKRNWVTGIQPSKSCWKKGSATGEIEAQRNNFSQLNE